MQNWSVMLRAKLVVLLHRRTPISWVFARSDDPVERAPPPERARLLFTQVSTYRLENSWRSHLICFRTVVVKLLRDNVRTNQCPSYWDQESNNNNNNMGKSKRIKYDNEEDDPWRLVEPEDTGTPFAGTTHRVIKCLINHLFLVS